MTKSISILGSTGSIGVQTLDVAENLKLKIIALSANTNIPVMLEQIRRFNPDLVSMANEKAALELQSLIKMDFPHTKVLWGQEGNNAVASHSGSDTTVAAMVGVAGLEPVMSAIKSGHDIALANKETLVAGGSFVMKYAKENNVNIYPVDSEHSAIWQCLPDEYEDKVRRIFLTASGGPFRGKNKEYLLKVKLEDALAHPTWAMGNKITIDSATLMNKGLEVIEAHWLFGISPDKIQVVVHPQSIIHSMVEFNDFSVIAQLGFADMRIPIHVALTKKKRTLGHFKEFDPFLSDALTFEKPDLDTFRCLQLAYDAIAIGGSMPAVMNSANEKAVELFLKREINFFNIPIIIEKVMNIHYKNGIEKSINCDIVNELDQWARKHAEEIGGRK